MAVAGGHRFPRQPRVWANLFFIGVTGTALPFTLIAWGQQSLDSSLAAIMMALTPINTMIVRGLVLPAEFIPVTEETGLIVPIGRWALREACRQMHAWQARFPSTPPLYISVNITSQQLSQPELLQEINQILRETGLDSRSLNLEITETVIMENIKSVIGMLTLLRDLKIQSWMDDFGTGYSSLNYLNRLPLDGLKIDLSFVSGTGVDLQNPDVIRTIMTLSRDLGKFVVAEGIETVEQLAQLRTLGCKYGQGYLFSKPLDGEAVEKLIPTRLGPPA